MIYTSYSLNNERFGFKMKGNFRCAYRFEKPFVIFGALAILIDAIVVLSIWASLEEYFGYSVKITTYLANPFGYGLAVLSIAIFVYLGIFLVLAYIIGLAIIRMGKKCDFLANEERFTISSKGRYSRTYVLIYEDVMGVTAKERSFPLTAGGLDITVTMKNGKKHLFKLTHTADTRSAGIVGCPFNIIQERAGLLSPHDYQV